ncbi:aldo/keto reductase [Chromohalobacter canadensis]|uniref:aldo/keto reductase n=1 Tax=Chromohalobacter canadensis TaxID=141389 RepID=UPI00240EFE16|nr:aldo/keto reductase [Chromohalobacter canadensis]
MPNRRQFLTGAAAAATATAAPRLLAAGEGSSPADTTAAGNEAGPISELPNNPPLASKLFPPEHKFGVGGTQLGNIFEVTPDDEAENMLEACWENGVRYFDTSPFYGMGLSERRLGHFLNDKPPQDYLLSTKMGRLLKPDASVDSQGNWKGDLNFSYHFDYTAAGTRRSVEDSLQRLGVPKLDIVYIHDLTPGMLGDDWRESLEVARKGAMPELSRMREEGIIGHWGMGVNNIETCLAAMEASDPDVMLQATKYNLMDHEDALNRLFPKCRKNDVSVIVGAPLGAGFLAGVNRWLYSGGIPDGYWEKRDRIARIAHRHGIDLRTVALQFTAAPDVVAATIPGARNAQQARENRASMTAKIPAELWQELKSEGLIAQDAPTPS